MANQLQIIRGGGTILILALSLISNALARSGAEQRTPSSFLRTQAALESSYHLERAHANAAPRLSTTTAGGYYGGGGGFASSKHNAWLSVGFKAFILPRLALHYEYTVAQGFFGSKGSFTVGTYLGLTGFGAINADVRAVLYMQWWRRSAMYFALQGGVMHFFSAPARALTDGSGLTLPEFDYAIGWRWQLGKQWHINLETSPGVAYFTSLPFISLGVGMKF